MLRPPFSRIAILIPMLANLLSAEAQGQQYAIPGQSLNSALLRFGVQSGLKLVYDADLVRGIRTAGVSASTTTEQGLQRLLHNTGMRYRYLDANTVTIERGGVENPVSKPTAVVKKSVTPVPIAETKPKPKPAPIKRQPKEEEPAMLGEIKVEGKLEQETGYARSNATTATKTDTPLMETPMSIQVVPTTVLQDQQAIRLQDATKNVSGVQTLSGFGDFYDQFLVRGFDSGTNLYRFRNGARVPNMTFETANLDRIEVLKGPASILYGRIEPGGLINAVTHKPLAQPYYALQQQVGSYDLYRTTLDATGPLTSDGSLLYRVDVAYLNKGSYRDQIGKDRFFVAPSLTWRPTSALEFNLNMEYRDDDVVFDGGIPAIGNRPLPSPIHRTYVIPGSAETFKGPLVEFNWSYKFNDAWKLRNGITAVFITNDYVETFPFTPAGNVLPLFLGIGRSHRDSYTAFFDINGHFNAFGGKHNLLIGADTHYLRETYDQRDVTDLQFDNVFNPVPPRVDLTALKEAPHNDVQDSRNQWYGIYFQDQITFFDKFHLLGGGRYDWAEVASASAFEEGSSLKNLQLSALRDEKFTPRVGIVYQPWHWLSLYGNYVESFGANNGRSSTGLPFAPQTATQYEGGLKTELLDGRLTGTLAFYHITKKNLLTADPTTLNPLDQRTVGEARSQGIEFDLAGQITDKLSFIATYAFTDARITKDFNGNQGKRLRLVPEHAGSFWLKYAPTERFSMGTGVYVTSERQGNTANSFQLPGYARWDAMAAYRFNIRKSRLIAQVNINRLCLH